MPPFCFPASVGSKQRSPLSQHAFFPIPLLFVNFLSFPSPLSPSLHDGNVHNRNRIRLQRKQTSAKTKPKVEKKDTRLAIKHATCRICTILVDNKFICKPDFVN